MPNEQARGDNAKKKTSRHDIRKLERRGTHPHVGDTEVKNNLSHLPFTNFFKTLWCCVYVSMELAHPLHLTVPLELHL